MDTVNISDLRANLLKYLSMAKEGESITATSNGQVLATINLPLAQKDAARSKLNALSQTAVVGDMTSPCEESWNVLS